MKDPHSSPRSDALSRLARPSVSWLCLIAALSAPACAMAQTIDSATMGATAVNNASNGNANDPAATSDSTGTPPPSGAPVSTSAFSPASIGGGTTSSVTTANTTTASRGNAARPADTGADADAGIHPPAKQNEFESWLQEVAGHKIKRFGIDLLTPAARDFAVPATSTIPPDYALNIGDVVSVSISGSMEGSANFEIDRDGRIFMPNVGSVSLIGVRYRDLRERIADAIGRKYRGYEAPGLFAKPVT